MMSNKDIKENKQNKQLQEYNRGNKAVQEYREDPYRHYKQPKSNQLKRQMVVIILCVVILGGLAGTYFAVLAPMLDKLAHTEESREEIREYKITKIETREDAKSGTTKRYGFISMGDKEQEIELTNDEQVGDIINKRLWVTATEEIELLDGEEIGPGLTNRIMITPKIDRKDTKNVYVKNKVDEYRVIHHLGEDIYYIEGAELAPYNPELLPNFYTNATYLLSMVRVAGKNIDDGNEILADLEEFGFNDDCAYFVVTKTDDTWYKIIIGDKIPTTGGYYVMYEDENGLREAIYIIDTMLEENILNTRYSLLMPIVNTPINMMTESIYIDNFKFYKGRDLFVEIYNGEIPEDSEFLVFRQMRYPAPYEVSDNYSTLLNTFSNFNGTQVVYAFGLDEEITDDILVKYGFDEYAARITFNYNDKEFDFVFSKPNEDGNYYVYSEEFYTIIEVTPDIVPFLEWDLLKFVGKPIFAENINNIAEIIIKSPGKTDAVFNIEGTGQDLVVSGNGKVLDMPKPDAHPTERVDSAWNFRQYYKTLLSMEILDYEEDVSGDSEPLLEMIVTKKNGEVYHYRFYFVPTNTRRSYFTVNGGGDFYVNRDRVSKLIQDTELVMQNLLVNADAVE